MPRLGEAALEVCMEPEGRETGRADHVVPQMFGRILPGWIFSGFYLFMYASFLDFTSFICFTFFSFLYLI